MTLTDDQSKNLVDLVRYIEDVHAKVSDEWKQYVIDKNLKTCNQHKTKVCKILEKPSIIHEISSYCVFLSNHNLKNLFTEYTYEGFETESRIKNYNSINDKVNRYTNSDTKGEVSINKCFNDLFGARAIIDSQFDHDDIVNLLRDIPDIKCIDSTKPPKDDGTQYNATHVYFKGKDNRTFQWELQIWQLRYKSSNHDSHEKYKQAYTKWETEEEEWRSITSF